MHTFSNPFERDLVDWIDRRDAIRCLSLGQMLILKMRADGYKVGEIAEFLHVHRNTVTNQLKELGR
jgi:DNA-binding MarR family transcriptional regulator